MSTAVSAASSDAGAATGDRLAEPGERGTLTIADRVVERVAGYAATQVEGASAAPRRLLGINVGDARPESEASVQARVDGRTATVEATIAVEWPRPVKAVAQQLRTRVREDVLRLTDVQVAHIDIDVVSFAGPQPRPRRVQ